MRSRALVVALTVGLMLPLLWSAGGAAWASVDRLVAAQSLPAGQSLWSANGTYRAVMQGDGNFVVYGPAGAVWSSGTRFGSGGSVGLQSDGNLVVRTAGGSAAWSTGTNPSHADILVMQDDGNLVLYAATRRALWSSQRGPTGLRGDRLAAGQVLSAGQGIWSAAGGFWAVMQDDGNFVVYGPAGATWSSRTRFGPGGRLVMQADGNLGVYAPSGVAVWSSGTRFGGVGTVVVTANGTLAVYSPVGQVVWNSVDGVVAPYFPTRLAHVGDARQLLVMTGDATGSSFGTLRAYQQGSDGVWRLALSAMPARSGYAGWVWGASRVENSGTSPIGTYRLTTAFGLTANPGTSLSYLHVDQDDYMAGDPRDPRTYDVWQTSASSTRTWRASTATSERFGAYPVQYQYGLIIDYNRPPAASVSWSAQYQEYVTSQPTNVNLGFSIYLHVNGTGSTAGCVSVALTDQLRVLRWLNPSMHPRIVMAPLSLIGQA